MTNQEIAQGQLDAYNNQDITGFLKWYSDDVEVYTFPNELVYKGKEEMKKRYSKAFTENPGQHADLVNRISLHNIVIDQEYVTGKADGITLEVVAIYTIVKGLIKKVYFIRGDLP